MKHWLFGIIIVVFGFFFSCGPKHQFDKSVKQLDSLKVVEEQALDNFLKVDSSDCFQAYSKTFTYISFIQTNVHDTLTKPEAEALLQFHNCSKNLKKFFHTRRVAIDNTKTSISQLKKLAIDLQSGAVKNEEAFQFIESEKKQAEQNIQELKNNFQLIFQVMEDYHKTVGQVEGLIKKRHQDVLPSLMKPELE